MRYRDDTKRLALLESTLEHVTEHGFSASSVAKIAHGAGVSPGTLYIYHKDKDGLLEAAFLYACDQLIDTALAHMDPSLDLRQRLLRIWRALFQLAMESPRLFRYHDMFSYSAWMNDSLRQRNDERLAPLLDALVEGQRNGVIKPVGLALLESFLFLPIYHLVQCQSCLPFEPTADNIDTAFSMAWDAVAVRVEPSSAESSS
ncbi:TetR/AcrR family transcriptional regulator [Halomonas sp. V046]|uniref:TetR/AcrR family transcriptional regulator n=1 Tax=Halomonas sp. V046 TaxID=3459611 RepID=UPI004043E867